MGHVYGHPVAKVQATIILGDTIDLREEAQQQAIGSIKGYLEKGIFNQM